MLQLKDSRPSSSAKKDRRWHITRKEATDEFGFKHRVIWAHPLRRIVDDVERRLQEALMKKPFSLHLGARLWRNAQSGNRFFGGEDGKSMSYLFITYHENLAELVGDKGNLKVVLKEK